jgi:hypothetical protein
MDPGSILTGWGGGPTFVVVVLSNGSSSDTLSVLGTNLGTVDLGANYMKSTRLAAGTMVMSGTTVTVTFTSSPPPGQTNFVASSTLTWTPSASATDTLGNPMSTTPVVESGAPKRNF